MSRKYLTLPSNPIEWPASPRDQSGDTPNIPYMGIQTRETTQRYTLGTRYTTWDGRVYKYALADAAVRQSHGCQRYAAQAFGWSAPAATAAAGSYEITVTVGATQQGTGSWLSHVSVFAKDGMAGGYVHLFDGGTDVVSTKGIVANSALSGAGDVTLYLDTPIYLELTASDAVEGMTSPFYNVRYTDFSGAPCVGIPQTTAAASDYFWAQTWGACFIVPQATFGSSSGETNLHGIMRNDGTIETHDETAAVGGITQNRHAQHAGYAMCEGTHSAQGAPFVMLQLSI